MSAKTEIIGQFLYVGAGICVGLILVVSSLSHLSNLYEFFGHVLAYDLLPISSAKIIAAGLPFLQMLVGLLILFRVWLREAAFCAVIMFVVFTLVQFTAVIRGLKIACGCFGYYSEPVSWLSIVRSFVFVGISLFLLLRYSQESQNVQSSAAITS